MGRGYSTEDIREKLILILKDSDSGMSGVEISEKVDINRITMIKYLKVLQLKDYYDKKILVMLHYGFWNLVKNRLISQMIISK